MGDSKMQTGKVKWFNAEKGYGFIMPDNGERDLFVHINNIDGGDTLAEGALVEFDTIDGRKGPEAASVRQTANV